MFGGMFGGGRELPDYHSTIPQLVTSGSTDPQVEILQSMIHGDFL